MIVAGAVWGGLVPDMRATLRPQVWIQRGCCLGIPSQWGMHELPACLPQKMYNMKAWQYTVQMQHDCLTRRKKGHCPREVGGMVGQRVQHEGLAVVSAKIFKFLYISSAFLPMPGHSWVKAFLAHLWFEGIEAVHRQLWCCLDEQASRPLLHAIELDVIPDRREPDSILIQKISRKILILISPIACIFIGLPY